MNSNASGGPGTSNSQATRAQQPPAPQSTGSSGNGNGGPNGAKPEQTKPKPQAKPTKDGNIADRASAEQTTQDMENNGWKEVVSGKNTFRLHLLAQDWTAPVVAFDNYHQHVQEQTGIAASFVTLVATEEEQEELASFIANLQAENITACIVRRSKEAGATPTPGAMVEPRTNAERFKVQQAVTQLVGSPTALATAAETRLLPRLVYATSAIAAPAPASTLVIRFAAHKRYMEPELYT